MKTNTTAGETATKSQRNAMIHAYLLQCIDNEGTTPKEKVKFLLDTFRSEVGKWRSPQIGEPAAFKEWCQGLPSTFNIAFENSEIVKLGAKWGLLPEPAEWGELTRKEALFVEQYWDRLYMNIKAMERKYK